MVALPQTCLQAALPLLRRPAALITPRQAVAALSKHGQEACRQRRQPGGRRRVAAAAASPDPQRSAPIAPGALPGQLGEVLAEMVGGAGVPGSAQVVQEWAPIAKAGLLSTPHRATC